MLNIVFVRTFGLMGAAYGTLLSYIIVAIAGHFVLVKLYDVEMKNVFANTIDYYRQGLFCRKADIERKSEIQVSNKWSSRKKTTYC
ncbi:MAG: polysaccharide biosynthesis C-terminal domain-containing protein [Bacteroidota bacterium]